MNRCLFTHGLVRGAGVTDWASLGHSPCRAAGTGSDEVRIHAGPDPAGSV